MTFENIDNQLEINVSSPDRVAANGTDEVTVT
jgi:hypothetical protein